MKQIQLGNGNVFINTVKSGDRIGVAFTKTDEEHEIYSGSESDVLDSDGNFNPDFVVWIGNERSGRVLQDVVNGALLMVNGWKVK